MSTRPRYNPSAVVTKESRQLRRSKAHRAAIRRFHRVEKKLEEKNFFKEFVFQIGELRKELRKRSPSSDEVRYRLKELSPIAIELKSLRDVLRKLLEHGIAGKDGVNREYVMLYNRLNQDIRVLDGNIKIGKAFMAEISG